MVHEYVFAKCQIMVKYWFQKKFRQNRHEILFLILVPNVTQLILLLCAPKNFKTSFKFMLHCLIYFQVQFTLE